VHRQGSLFDMPQRTLAAPHTTAILKQANKLPMAQVLLDKVEKSEAPDALRRGLRDFRDQSWAGVNSYAHAGLLALGRVAREHPEVQLVQAVQVRWRSRVLGASSPHQDTTSRVKLPLVRG
jgi:hypothetical protein